MRRITLPVLAVLVLLAVPAGASAHKPLVRHPTTDPVTLALNLAEQYWGATPCEGYVTIRSDTPPSRITDGGVPVPFGVESGAWAEFDTPTGPNNYSEPYSVYTGCVIWFNSTDWPNWLADDENFQEFCAFMTHEIGHLVGHPDSAQDNPESIEYPLIGINNINSVPQCQHVVLNYKHQRFVSF